MSEHFPLMAPGASPCRRTVEVEAPWDGSVIATVESGDSQTIEHALATAARLFEDRDGWLPVPRRLEILEKTATIMIFVSKGYFKSANCLREADCTVAQNKHVALMHDPVKGGATLDFIKENECPERLLKPIFTRPDGAAPRKVITWHRIKDFQLVSLKLLTEQMLLGCATYNNLPDLPLYLPGEISAKKLIFSHKVCCRCNP